MAPGHMDLFCSQICPAIEERLAELETGDMLCSSALQRPSGVTTASTVCGHGIPCATDRCISLCAAIRAIVPVPVPISRRLRSSGRMVMRAPSRTPSVLTFMALCSLATPNCLKRNMFADFSITQTDRQPCTVTCRTFLPDPDHESRLRWSARISHAGGRTDCAVHPWSSCRGCRMVRQRTILRGC